MCLGYPGFLGLGGAHKLLASWRLSKEQGIKANILPHLGGTERNADGIWSYLSEIWHSKD
jgi:hypothetical protein